VRSAERQEYLTDRAYWDSQYEPAALGVAKTAPSRTKTLLRRLLGPKLLDVMRDYREYLVWDVIYPKYLPRRNGTRVLEVGSAPGTHLVRLHEAFGFEPYGVEYTPRGAAVNKKLFQLHGLDPANVVHADFFSPEFQRRYRNHFDVVFSRGFIEHFGDVPAVVAAHVNVLAPGGLLFVAIPNLRGINYGLTWFFWKELLSMHNLSIMKRDAFSKLFDTQALIGLFCDYVGSFSFRLFDARPGSKKGPVLALCCKAQLVLNAILRTLFKAGGLEHRWFSTHLVFIGLKRP
jgi:SAM-dependent methyltransferase